MSLETFPVAHARLSKLLTQTFFISNCSPPVMCDRGREGLQAEPELKRSFRFTRYIPSAFVRDSLYLVSAGDA